MHFSILNVLRLDLGAVWALPLRKLVETHSQRKKKKKQAGLYSASLSTQHLKILPVW